MENVDMTFIPSLLKRTYAGGFVLKVFKYSRVYRQNLMLDPDVVQPKGNHKKHLETVNHSALLGILFCQSSCNYI